LDVSDGGGAVSVPAAQGPAPEVGEALRARVDDVIDRMLAHLGPTNEPTLAPRAVEAAVSRSARSGTLAVAEFLSSGQIVTSDRAEDWDWSGGAPLVWGVTLSGVTTAYLQWRRATGEVLNEVMSDLGTPAETRKLCEDVLQVGFDTALVRMAKRFELTRHALEEQLAENRARLEHQALHDPLTGLANRVLLLDRLEHAVQAAPRRATRPAVLFMDLDYFKSVNDASGHSAGDQLLVEVAGRLTTVVRPNDTIARLGGDEFVVLCEDLADPLAEAKAVAERIAACLDPPFTIAGKEVFVAASIGIAPAAESDDAESLLAFADQAMYRAKKLGRGRIEVYDPAVDRQVTRQAEISTAMHHALGRSELHVAYQPVMDLGAQEVIAREALLRWTHPSFGPVPPSEFIPLAEESGLINEIGRWVLRRACTDCAAWRAADSSDIGVAVNVSGRQLEDPRFEDEVAEALDQSGLAPGALTLEVTESLLMAGRADARAVLERVRSTGVRIAVDDFGTGYSSLSWLARLPLDVMKVDRSFIASLGLVERESAIVEAMIHLAHTLGLLVVAEGVETDSQLSRLTNLGCDSAQGFLLGYPEPMGERRQERATG
jgi:diguanylate cyclase (GGDEF)-like protein